MSIYFIIIIFKTNLLLFLNEKKIPYLLLFCLFHGLSADIQVKELDKRASGQAFEVILANADGAKSDPPLAQPQKKDVSLEEIQRKLDAAEERRKVNERLVVMTVCP